MWFRGLYVYGPGDYKGARPDRHDGFREHYPDGYRMDFITLNEVRDHEGLARAYAKNQKLSAIEEENNKVSK